MSHTPGPWKFDGRHVTDVNDWVIAIEGIAQPHGVTPPDHQSWANARLIAAAPELLEALKDYLSTPTAYYATKAQIAINKAEGRL